MTTTTPAPPVLGPAEVPRQLAPERSRADRRYRRITSAAGVLTLALMGLIGVFLLVQAVPALDAAGLSFLTEWQWNPDVDGGQFGIGAVLYWTVVIAAIALLVAIPVSVGAALFISEYAPRRLRGVLTSLVDLLAAVPSIIYGLWGFFFLQPELIGVSRWLTDHLSFIPVLRTDRDDYASSAFVAGIVVAIMVVPICTSVMREVFSQAPPGEKEGALALGGSRWGMIRSVVLPFGRGGIIGGAMLGLGRALGETIAVYIIISPVFAISNQVLEGGANSIASLIALRFGESGQAGIEALMAAGLTLFVLTLAVNVVASTIVSRSRSGAGVEL